MAGSTPSALDDFVAALPKVELHVHLEGSVQPATLLASADKHGISDLQRTLEEVRSWYEFRDFVGSGPSRTFSPRRGRSGECSSVCSASRMGHRVRLRRSNVPGSTFGKSIVDFIRQFLVIRGRAVPRMHRPPAEQIWSRHWGELANYAPSAFAAASRCGALGRERGRVGRARRGGECAASREIPG